MRQVRRVSVQKLRAYNRRRVNWALTWVPALGLVMVGFLVAALWMLLPPLMYGTSPSIYQDGSASAERPPTINITKEQYESALAKWKSHNIEAYEIWSETRAYMGGGRRLRVSNYGKDVELIMPWRNDTPTAEDLEYYKEYSVEGMFETVEAMLNEEFIMESGTMSASGCFYMAYTVEFDQQLGYPSRLAGVPVTCPDAWVSHADFDTKVTTFKILKQGAPTPARR
ncbi:MAG TPA: hypothetical protein VEW94_10610 [Chloroflexia bacterium]|nr:hypothetical protein [Chloroflexia bacterium]